METSYYNLSGGICLSRTKTELGLDTKKMYWSDSENVEIYKNRGISKQSGNTLICSIPNSDGITGMFEMVNKNDPKLVITTESGKIYIYNPQNSSLTKLNKTISSQKPVFTAFLNGVLISGNSDSLFYIKNNTNFDIVECNLTDLSNNSVKSDIITIFKSRVWVASGSTIYYSALGSYTDFKSSNDAGYINDFHTDTAAITGLKPYKDYLAIYKKDMVYLLTGTSAEDFAIVPFADKGTKANNSIVNVENKQYFLSSGIFCLEQVGELNQIQLGSEISLNIKPEFDNFDDNNISKAISIHYEKKNQVWYFVPYKNQNYFHTIWINDYVNKAWYKRILPQNITYACLFNNYVYTSDKDGNIYCEDFGQSFAGTPIKFMWKSPFLALGSPHRRKLIDEFYFVLDDAIDNDFNFSVYKDYDSTQADDPEKIYSVYFDQLIWAQDESLETASTSESLDYCWAKDEGDSPVWTINRDVLEKAEISESNYAIQLCVEGNELTENLGIIGLEFREVYSDN